MLYSLDVETEKLERRKARFHDSNSKALEASWSHIETPFPKLPLPSVSPMTTNLSCTKEKALFMSKLGLKKVAPKEKKGLLVVKIVHFELRLK